MCSVCGGRRAAGASPIRCVGERITATGVPEFREVAWRAYIVFWDEAVDQERGKVRDEFPCHNCGATLSKRSMERSWKSEFDFALKKPVKQAKSVPVQINYSINGVSGRFEKRPDSKDIDLIDRINKEPIPDWFPCDELPDGFNTKQPKKSHGLINVHHFYTNRNLRVLATLRRLLKTSIMEEQLLCLVGDQLPRASKMHKIAISRLNTNLSKTAGILAGTLYIPSNQIEYCLISMIGFRIKDITSYQRKRDAITKQLVSNSSTSNLLIPNESLDYMFFDPPFGANLNYSELNFLWEAWLKVFTNNTHEAIENKVQGKSISEYRSLMTDSFKEAYRTLKKGRWLTVEFSNTKASVWNNIQTAITDAGFIVSNVSALDKKQHTIKALTTPSAVKQDLIISAYKPNGGFEERFTFEPVYDGVWDFVKTHLGYLPIIKIQSGQIVPIQERDPRLLFDQVVAYFVRKGLDVPVNSQEFQIGLKERFLERYGMFFLPEQVEEYDKKRLSSSQLRQLSIFVDDEASAIEWLRQQLNDKPKTYQEIHPLYINELSGWKKNEAQLELSELLEQNFLCYDGVELVPSQIHNYLSTNFKDQRNLGKDDPVLKSKAKNRWYVPNPDRAQDLEKLRERSLLKEFDEYKQFTGKRMKSFRLEVIRAGFKKAWQEKDYSLIVQIAGKIPDASLQEDPKLLMWYDQALTRLDS